MAHFARIDQTGTVIGIIKVRNEDIMDENGNEVEQKGIDLLQSLFPNPAWDYKQTSYNACEGVHRVINEDGSSTYHAKACCRKNYASIGGKYDYERDAFIPQRYFDGQVYLDEECCVWRDPFQIQQRQNNDGGDSGIEDQTDYSGNRNMTPGKWVWDQARKTYVNTGVYEAPVKMATTWNEETQTWNAIPQDQVING